MFEVLDTGTGMAKEHRQLVCDSFTQVEIFINRRFEGAGVDLSI